MTRQYLKEYRSIRGISQNCAAKTINVSESYYNMIENGERQQDMSYSIMEKLATAFEVPVQKIIDAETAYRTSQDSA